MLNKYKLVLVPKSLMHHMGRIICWIRDSICKASHVWNITKVGSSLLILSLSSFLLLLLLSSTSVRTHLLLGNLEGLQN